MTVLYNCRHDGDIYRITKFDNLGNVESSYLCDEQNCDCPAGQRRVCRHREMLPLFIRRGAVNSGWQLDYDRGGWVQMFEDTPALTSEGVSLPEVEHTTPADTLPDEGQEDDYEVAAARAASTTPAELEYIDDPEDDNILDEDFAGAALGPPITNPPPAKTWRRF